MFSYGKELTMRLLPVVSAMVIGFSFVGGAAYTQFATADEMTTFTVTTPADYMATRIDLTGDGRTIGDLRFMNTTFSGDGLDGSMPGWAGFVDVGSAEDPIMDTMGTLVFEFGDADSIVVAVDYELAPNGEGSTVNGTQFEAITGGTGKFVGARGQVAVTEDASGAWAFEFQLLD